MVQNQKSLFSSPPKFFQNFGGQARQGLIFLVKDNNIRLLFLSFKGGKMGIEEEIERILAGSKFLEKSEFIEKVIRGAEDELNLDEGWRETLTNEKRVGDLWEFIKNTEWFIQNLKTIKKKYTGQVVLVCNQDIVFSSEDSNEVINKISSLGLEPNQCYVSYVPNPGKIRFYTLENLRNLKASINRVPLFLFSKTGSNIPITEGRSVQSGPACNAVATAGRGANFSAAS